MPASCRTGKASGKWTMLWFPQFRVPLLSASVKAETQKAGQHLARGTAEDAARRAGRVWAQAAHPSPLPELPHHHTIPLQVPMSWSPPGAHIPGAHQRVQGCPHPVPLPSGLTVTPKQLKHQRAQMWSALHTTTPAPALSAITLSHYPY